jgi:hypothetical protein
MTEKIYKPIARFNDHGATCKGHANWMLDCEFTKQEERDVMINVLDRLINETK